MKIAISKLRKHIFKYIAKELQESDEPIIVVHKDKPIAKIVRYNND